MSSGGDIGELDRMITCWHHSIANPGNTMMIPCLFSATTTRGTTMWWTRWPWTTTQASKWQLLDFSTTLWVRRWRNETFYFINIEITLHTKLSDQTRLLCHQPTHQRMHQRTEQRGEGIRRVQRQQKIQTTTALEETLRLAYLFAQRRMLTSTRYITTSWDINLLILSWKP